MQEHHQVMNDIDSTFQQDIPLIQEKIGQTFRSIESHSLFFFSIDAIERGR